MKGIQNAAIQSVKRQSPVIYTIHQHHMFVDDIGRGAVTSPPPWNFTMTGCLPLLSSLGTRMATSISWSPIFLYEVRCTRKLSKRVAGVVSSRGAMIDCFVVDCEQSSTRI